MALIKHGNNALSNVTAFPSAVPTGKPVLLSTATASSSSSIEFTSGIDSTYDVYKFEFINIHLGTDNTDFTFNLSTDSGSNYNVTKTTTSFNAQHSENDTYAKIAYVTATDLAQGTGNQNLSDDSSSDSDHGQSGYMYLFSPSSSTYVKHFIANMSTVHSTDMIYNWYFAGYGNTTSPINAIKFVMSSGNIDAGTIKMYGISA